MTKQKIKLAIIDDHQSIIDGYKFGLSKQDFIEVVATAKFGNQIEDILENQAVDVLILDVQVPISPDNKNTYPILHVVPTLLDRFAELNILIISMHQQAGLIKALVEAGVSGYIVKDDQTTIMKLGEVIKTIANGGIHLSDSAYQQLSRKYPIKSSLTPCQLEVLSLCAAYPGETTLKLARKINVAHSTFRNLLSGAYLRLDVQNRTAAIEKIRQLGLISPRSQDN